MYLEVVSLAARPYLIQLAELGRILHYFNLESDFQGRTERLGGL